MVYFAIFSWENELSRKKSFQQSLYQRSHNCRLISDPIKYSIPIEAFARRKFFRFYLSSNDKPIY